VTPEGSVLIPEFGEVYLGQISLTQAKQKISAALEKRYRNVEISITLSHLRKLKVSIDGEVNYPGIFTVSSMDRVTEALKLAGGLTKNASERNMRLIRADSIINADILLYARGGDYTCNPYLLEGDKIIVPPRYEEVGLLEVYGAVKFPGEYEYADGDRVYDLILIAGGVTVDADTSSATIIRIEQDLDSTINIDIDLKQILEDPASEANIKLKIDDRLFVRSYPDYHRKAQVTIEGEVRYPGVYAIKDDTTTLVEVIEMAGGFTEAASLDEAEMFRSGYIAIGDTELDRRIKLSAEEQLSGFEREYLILKSDPQQGRISVDFRELFEKGNMTQNITLRDEDRIIIPRYSNTVRILGRVIKPGLITYSKDARLDYYLERAGGLSAGADKGGIRIVKSGTGSIVKPSSKIPIEVGDEILVPEKKPTDWWQVTKDVGLFLANLATVYYIVDRIID
jgi:protein involved in polysaccharide export with SLBB domain